MCVYVCECACVCFCVLASEMVCVLVCVLVCVRVGVSGSCNDVSFSLRFFLMYLINKDETEHTGQVRNKPDQYTVVN